ncbi:Endocytosis and vacuole integrity protein [Paramarasmius palmivorus]|uniref:Endocytosis and vacuole integrity protein n=1 Tax=Paramarasmius palmivorus TaxID=297713 RepID=A0AAW0C055_9AGAR
MATPTKKTAFVTGAGQGIGLGIALQLARDGLNVAINDISSNAERANEALQQLREATAAHGGKASVHFGDVSDEDQVKKMIDDVVREHGSLDVYRVSRSITEHQQTPLQATADDLDKLLAVNFKGVFFAYKYAAKQMIAQGRPGRIIGASSVTGKQGAQSLSVYSATKFAVRGLTQVAARELGSHKITVNAYAPGCIETEMIEKADAAHAQHLNGQNGDLKALFAASSCLGYNGTPADVASLVSYLASDAAHFITVFENSKVEVTGSGGTQSGAMSSLAFLVTELQSLASETRRKHPELIALGYGKAAEKSLAILRASPEQATANLASEGPQSDDLLKPVFMGCATKNAKVVAISLGSLQRLIALKAVPQSAVPLIVKTMSDAMSQGVDIQLKILQTLLSLITNFPEVHGALLGDALLLCFKLQESKIAVVSSTAAATLRQLVMFVVDKMVDEDRRDDLDPTLLSSVTLPDGSTISLGPSAKDAYSVFEDLCLLANSEKPNFLRLEFLHKTFALELIESVLTNYHGLFKKHNELILLLRHHLCPLLLKALSDRAIFPLTLRCTRVAFLLLKQFSGELETEAEVFLMMFIRIISDEADEQYGPARPPWVRVLAMEIMRGDAELIRNVWDRYDAHPSGNSKVFTSLITALNRLVTEKPALLGVSSQMFGVGVPHDVGGLSPSSSSYSLDMGGMAGMVATAASATVSNVVGMMSSGAGLSLQGSTMKLQCIDQLDKADSPPIPESYLYLLAVQCLVSLCEGLAAFSAPLYTSIVIQRPRAAGEAPVRAPPSLDISSLPPDDPQTKQLRIVRDIIENGWPALLAALSFIISTNLSDELFVDVLASFQAMTNVSGMLGLSTPRDAFFTSLSKFAVPTRVVSSLESYIEPQTPRTASSISENLGLGGGAIHPPGLSERNLACLKVLIASAMFLAGSLSESWFGILEVLQNADYVLTSKGTGLSATPSKRGSTAGVGRAVSGAGSLQPGAGSSSGTKHPLLSDLDSDSILNAMQRLFDASKNLEDEAFKSFVKALCKLSAEMVGMQTDSRDLEVITEGDNDEDDGRTLTTPTVVTSSVKEASHRRRVSGIHIPRTLRSGDFGINKLGQVALLNVHRLIYRPPSVAWDTTTGHLLSIICLPVAPQSIRIQAARVLDEILVIVPRNLTNTGDLQAEVQRRVLDVLAKQVVLEQSALSHSSMGTAMELRRMGLETLHQILQASGHTLVIGWETIFYMLESVCKPPPPPLSRSASTDSVVTPSASPVKRHKPLALLGQGTPSEKSYTALIKIAFQSLTLVCDSVTLLSPEHLRLCITTLGQFGRQVDTNIALTATASLLWSVSDAIQAKRKDAEQEPEYSELWMFLLLEMLGLCTDERPEVRDGAIQTLFRTMQLYGATLSEDTWDQCIWKITFPLLDDLTNEIRRRSGLSPASPGEDLDSNLPMEKAWDDSKILAFHSIGSIFQDFLITKIIRLESFARAWDVFVTQVQDTVLLDNRPISSPALRCLEKVIKASAPGETEWKDKTTHIWQRVWEALDHIGEAVLKKSGAQSLEADNALPKPFTQESLVSLIDVLQCMRGLSRALDGQEWPLERLTRLMAILKGRQSSQTRIMLIELTTTLGVLTYSNSPDYRPDIDALPPLQTAIMDTINGIDLSSPGSPSLVLQDLSEFSTLPFLAAFDVPQNPRSQTPQKRITYIALAKKTMPLLVDLSLRFKDKAEIYIDGTLEAVLSAYSIPVKLKYDCPAPSKHGKDQPLWKTATTCFLKIVKECSPQIKALEKEIPDECVASLWRQILDVYRGGILADCTAAEAFPLHVQEEEENFDLALIGSLEIDVIPHIGDLRVPDSVIAQLSQMLSQGSRLYDSDYGVYDRSRSRTPDNGSNDTNSSRHSSKEFVKVDIERHLGHGSTSLGALLPRERFSYWCFDLLFLICSDTTKDQEHSRKRLAALNLISLLSRCKTTLVGYVADEALRGNLPFPRAREDELLYVLRKLLELKLWPGSHWATLSSDPTAHCIEQPSIEQSSTPSQLIADAVKRSSVAHLFYFYPVLCEIASIPRKTPTTWTVVPETDGAARIDARSLAKECLKVVGKEMGVS